MSAMWAEVLDAFEARLDDHATALVDGTVDRITPFEPPALPGPVPDDLTDRAVALLRRCRELEDRIGDCMTSVQSALDRAPDAAAQAAEPVYFDSRI